MGKKKASMLKKGSVDLLLILKDGKKSFTELKTLALSPSTMLARLRDAQRKGWVKEELSPQKGKKSRIKYCLTKEGAEVFALYEPVMKNYVELRRELDELEKKVRKKEKEMKYLLVSVMSTKQNSKGA